MFFADAEAVDKTVRSHPQIKLKNLLVEIES